MYVVVANLELCVSLKLYTARPLIKHCPCINIFINICNPFCFYYRNKDRGKSGKSLL